MDELDEPKLLRKYLLGMLDDEGVQARLEERLMVNEDFAVRIAAAEDELIEEFLDGEMTADESDRFNRFFLAPPERKRQLRLTRDLRRVSAATAAPVLHPAARSASFSWLRYAVVAGAMLIAVLGVWRFGFFTSDTDRGLEQLRAAYRDHRPVESRITQFPTYAPYSETRSGEKAKVSDPSALEGANRYLIDATRGSGDATAHHALGVYHLASGDLDAAEREIKIALQNSPKDARIQSDAGALYLEKARQARDQKDDAGEIILLNESLKHLDLAISSDPKLLDARFNRALCLQALMNTEQAKAAWREYLEHDPDSKWADEARQHLQELENNTPRERSAEQLESDFLIAFRNRDHAEAERLIGGNRELIRDKYLPLRLAMLSVSPGEQSPDELRNALEYTGEIEMKLTGDPFAKEIARFYRSTDGTQRETLTRAHEAIREGFKLCLKPNYKDALTAFERARLGFEESGDTALFQISQYFVAYALINLSRGAEAGEIFNAVHAWARQNDYRWLDATALHWVGSSLLNERKLTDARRTYEEALAIGREINDSYAIQRNMLMLALVQSLCGQQESALKFLFAAIKESTRPDTSLRQRHRNLFFAYPILFRAHLDNAAMPAALEVVALADHEKDLGGMAQSRGFAALASAQMGKVDIARAFLQESKATAERITTGSRERMVAFSNLRFADFERSVGNYDSAETLYREALAFYDGAPQESLLREEAHTGLLLTYLAAGRSAELEAQIPVNIRMTEDYRQSILDQEQQIGFFDLRANVYDIAAEFEFDRGNLETAYNFAETSSSRVLLNQMQKGIRKSEHPLLPDADGSPLDLAAIRAQLPEGVQAVQYSVFEHKTVIWVISRDVFNAVPVTISAKELKDRVSAFTKAVSNRSPADDTEAKSIGAELYKLLVEPAMQHLRRDAELCIIPSGFLFDLPFAALPAVDGKPLITNLRLMYAPSANVFVLSTGIAAARRSVESETLLAVGNPAFDRRAFDDLPYLPDSEREVNDIADSYPQTKKLVGDDATKDAVLKNLSGANVVHVAGHYVTMPGSPMSSYLLLAADGDDPARSELTNLELAGSAMDGTRLIVLAACRSGVEGYYGGEGMAGMSRTMLSARVPLVVASQWNVDSAATAELMKRFHRFRRQEGMSTTAALRQAQIDLINDPTGRFSSPYYWAAFAVYGGHAEF